MMSESKVETGGLVPQGYELKGVVVRGSLAALRELSLFDAVASRVDPGVRKLMTAPPLPSEWVDGALVEQFDRAVGQVAPGKLREYGAACGRSGMLPIVRTTLEGFLRLFGTRPSTLLGRLAQLGKLGVRGIDYVYTETSEGSGVLEIRCAAARDVPTETFHVFAGLVEDALHMCTTDVHVADPEFVRGEPVRRVARLNVRWSTSPSRGRASEVPSATSSPRGS